MSEDMAMPTRLLWERLIFARNILLNDRSTQNVVDALNSAQFDLPSIEVASTRNLIGVALSHALNEIGNSKYRSAGFILHLVHNLPLDEASFRVWDIDYFLSIELPSFLDHYDDIFPARAIVLEVISEIARDYSVRATQYPTEDYQSR